MAASKVWAIIENEQIFLLQESLSGAQVLLPVSP
jgi:hypothetical protein